MSKFTRSQILKFYHSYYLTEGLSIEKIANRLNCNKKTIRAGFAKYNCELKTSKERNADKRKHSDFFYKIVYERDYIQNEFTYQVCSELNNTSVDDLFRNFKRLGLKTRTQKEAIKLNQRKQKPVMVPIFNEIIQGNLSIKKAAKSLNISISQLYRQFRLIELELPKPTGACLTNEDINLVITLYYEGESYNRIAERLSISPKKVEKLITGSGIKKRNHLEAINNGLALGHFSGKVSRNANLDVNFFKQWTAESAWVFGLLLSDGSIGLYEKSHMISLVSIDKDMLINVANLFGIPVKCIYPRENKGNGSHSYSLQCTHKGFIQTLLNLGMESNKAYTVSMPLLPQDMYRHFIRGYIDGDGSFTLGSNKLRFGLSSCSKIIMFQIISKLFELASIGIVRKRSAKSAINKQGSPELTVYFRKIRRSPIYYLETSAKENIRKLAEFLYKGVPPNICLARKRNAVFKYLYLPDNY